MCGIFGYIGKQNIKDITINGLHRLEHRGYDAAGIGVVLDEHLLNPNLISRVVIGTVNELEETILQEAWERVHISMGHVRWPTHGKNTAPNAHPHFDCTHRVMLVHNGMIDNHVQLRETLAHSGHHFSSETDTEVIAHLIERECTSDQSSINVICDAVRHLRGTYALAISLARDPHALYVIRKGSPLVIGIGEQETFIASEPYAFSNHTNRIIALEENILARITSDGIECVTLTNRTPHQTTAIEIEIPEQPTHTAHHQSHMLREIYHQPEVARQFATGCFSADNRSIALPVVQPAFADLHLNQQHEIEPYDRIVILACGTAYHAGLIGRTYFESLAGIPTFVHHASDFQTGPFNMTNSTLVIAISQSGETWDTRSALALAKTHGKAKATIAVVNNACTSIEREADYTLLMRAGIEIGVAATKTFSAQCLSLLLLALAAGEKTLTTCGEVESWKERIERLPQQIQACIERSDKSIKVMVRNIFERKHHTVFIGRGAQYHVAQEGALKLKEIAYIPSDAQPSKELKHGPLALIDERCLSIAVMPYDMEATDGIAQFEADMNSLAEIRARNGETLAITTDDAPDFESEWTIRVPHCHKFLLPLLTIIPLQLLAYHWSVALGYDPDKPRNLAKSVTVG